MADEWSNQDWIQKSITNRANRYSTTFKPHKGGSNSIATICQKLSEKEGREVSQIEAWVYTHRGLNPQDPSSLNTEQATACLERYKTKAIELNGLEFDWLHSPVDARALYQCSCGRPHGKWATFNGMVDDSEILAEAKSDRVSSRASKRQRQEEEEREKRRLSDDARVAKKDAHVAKEDARLAKEYAQTILEWGRGVHNQYNSLQSFMQKMAEHTGMPSSAVPPVLPLPPLPPTYGVSASQNLSPENPHTVGSAIGVENQDDIFHRVAHGMFGGYVNTSGEAGGNYSPSLDDHLSLF
ncbi:uncharacterized protein LOC133908371 [Phragmites australis]|uniref:uncharacterized protein LOC133908371 n=1 Tax=Phragmites australis TaxID=29695 RepID=UPI002D790998|nr:uncharacterized protein LOC133908371 [Phragmites australis]XP_062206348.1 uncharacterized protein LOC133908371 [Phragmites australis]XP_062206349.1 uncharacterized protein LOC133908371 [Phragmites australis]XP_062206350.1 uncharacterized protein LOC133908371 [Phragmites australis]